MRASKLLACWTSLVLAFLCLGAGESYAQLDPQYNIVSYSSGKCLDVSGGPGAQDNGAPVVVWDCNDGTNQSWRMLPAYGGYHKLVVTHSLKALDVRGGPTAIASGVPVEQWDSNNADNQRWLLVQAGPAAYQTYKFVAKHSGKVLEVNGGPGAVANGTQVQQGDDRGTDNQRWRLEIRSISFHPVMTSFVPSRNGFRFKNTFINDLGGGARSAGLSGGMAYAALDYWMSATPIPTIDYVPAIGTPLQTYLFNRQTTQVVSNFDRFEDMLLASGPRANTRAYYERSVSRATLRELSDKIDAGMPVVLALQSSESVDTHSVLAIGYDMGRYVGDLGVFQEDVKLFVYDPKYPSVIRTLSAYPLSEIWSYSDDLRRSRGYTDIERWLTFFVDTRYRSTPPPRIETPNLGGLDGRLRELRVTISTGGDELVGGNDDIDLIVTIDGLAPQVFHSLNNHMRWINNYAQTVSLRLAAPVAAGRIRKIQINKTAKKTLLGVVDAWDLDGVIVDGYGGGLPPVRLFEDAGHPLIRLDASRTSYLMEARIH